MVALNDNKRYIKAICDHSSQTEPTPGEVLCSVLPSQRAGLGHCDVTGREPKSQTIMNSVIF